ncbi:MAG TPA: hypothetical protein VG755_09810 [Nannocystaceae bacterium]|nr:hypothetical protein [Nannocystaceae bacterium]
MSRRRAIVCMLVLAACPRERTSTTPTEPPSHEPPIAAHDVVRDPPAPLPTPRPREPGTIYEDELERVTSRGPAWLLRQLAPEAHRRSGRFAGWTITACFPDDPELAAAADLEIGDIIVAVEGDALATPNAYSALFERAGKLDALHVARIRDGRREELVYRIAAAPLPADAPPGYASRR